MNRNLGLKRESYIAFNMKQGRLTKARFSVVDITQNDPFGHNRPTQIYRLWFPNEEICMIICKTEDYYHHRI
jgi:hypothetical protein